MFISCSYGRRSLGWDAIFSNRLQKQCFYRLSYIHSRVSATNILNVAIDYKSFLFVSHRWICSYTCRCGRQEENRLILARVQAKKYQTTIIWSLYTPLASPKTFICLSNHEKKIYLPISGYMLFQFRTYVRAKCDDFHQ